MNEKSGTESLPGGRLPTDVEGWTHYVAELDRSTEVQTLKSVRPISIGQRASSLSELLRERKFQITANDLLVPLHRLSPRAPYQSAPRAHLTAHMHSWMLSGESDSLSWDATYGPFTGQSGIEFWFKDITIPEGRLGLMTLKLKAAPKLYSKEPGYFEIRSSAANPRIFPVTAYDECVVDVVIRPERVMFNMILLTLTIQAGLGRMEFNEATFSVL